MINATLDQQFERRVQASGAGDGLSAAELIRVLGWHAPQTQDWESGIGLAPSRELPRMIARDLGDAASPHVERFQEAHVTGVLHGLVLDRVLDGQALGDARLELLQRGLAAQWRAELGDALGSQARGDAWVQRAVIRQRRAARAEARVLHSGSLQPTRYFLLAQEKLWWALLPAWGLLVRASAPRLAAAATAFGALLVSLQCFDDAVDAAEDTATRGNNFPAALGVAPGALEFASLEVTRRAQALARDAQLPSLADFCRERAAQLAARSAPRIVTRDRLRGAALALESEATFHNTDRWLTSLLETT